MTTHLRYFLLALILATVAAAHAQGAGGIVYITGGIGVTEREQLKALEKEFNLKLMFTLIEGNYISDVGIVVKDAAGKVLVAEQANGPIFMLKLPPGTYVVEATYDGKTHTRRINVDKRLRTEHLRWPSNSQVDFAIRE